MALVKWSPFAELEAMDRRMRRLFGEGGLLAPAALPAADIYETEDEIVVELEVPGFEESELDVEVADHTLTIKGQRMEEKEKKERSFQLRERLEARFERTFSLPAEADTEHVQATFGKGVLEIHTPKLKEAGARKVPIGQG